MTESQSFDLVVIGGGYAGLTAANRAAQLGLKAVVLERGSDALYPCNSRFAGGVLHVSYRNLKDPPSELAGAVEAITEGQAEPALAQALGANAARALDWLTQQGAQYGSSGAIGWRQWVLAPVRPRVPHLDWEGHGSDLTLRRLEGNFTALGGAMHRGVRAQSLIMDDDRCVGVEAVRGDARSAYRARAVVIADGGYQADLELVGRHITRSPQALKQRCANTGTGDGLKMAQRAGAAVTRLDKFYGHLLSHDAFVNDRIWPYPVLDDLAAAAIIVDARGKRVADEGRGGVYLVNALARLDDPAGTHIVFDEAIWQGPGRATGIPANPHLIAHGASMHRTESIDALARQAAIDTNGLHDTLLAYNEAVRSGRLTDLDPPRSAHEYMPMRIATPPFYAVPICAGITFTMGGIAIDPAARVLRPDRTPIRGLYAAGCTTGGLDGGDACGYAGGLMKAIVFGMLAAEDAAKSRQAS